LTGEVSMGVLIVFLVLWKRGRYIVPDQQGDIKGPTSFSSQENQLLPKFSENVFQHSFVSLKQILRFMIFSLEGTRRTSPRDQ